MNIAMMCESFPPAVRGGVEMYTWYVSTELANRGNNVDVFTTAKQAPLELVHPPTFRVHHVKLNQYLLRNISNEFDIVNVQNYSRLSYLMITTAQRANRTVLTSHGALIGPQFEFDISVRYRFKFAFDESFDRILSPLLLHKTRGIITLTRNEKKHIIDKFHIEPSKIVVAPAVLPDEAFEEPKAETSMVLPSKYIVSIGRLSERKSLDHVLRLLPYLPEIHFVIAGQDQGALLNLLAQAVKNGVRDRIHYLGVVSENQKRVLLRNCLLFVQPSRWEMQSTSVLEAMAQRAVAVVSDVGANRELVDDGKNGFLYPYGDLKRLFDIIVMLRDNENLRREVGERGRYTAWSNHRVKKVATIIEKMFRAISEH
jgi:glycosyltransferase involved in cell wall biosynthesis